MPSQTGPVLVVGYTMAMQKALDTFMPDDSCRFVDEPTVARKREAAAHVAEARAATGVIEWEYQLPGAADRFANAHPDLAPVAVLPGVEYAVPFAARLAERYGLPGAGYGGATRCWPPGAGPFPHPSTSTCRSASSSTTPAA